MPHFQYKVNSMGMNPPLADDRVDDGDILRIVSFLNNNGYSAYPAFNGILQFDVFNHRSQDVGIESGHLKIIRDFGYEITQITEQEYKAAFEK